MKGVMWLVKSHWLFSMEKLYIINKIYLQDWAFFCRKRRKEERWRVASHIAERRNERKSSGRATTDESSSTRQQGQQVQQAQEEPDPAHPEGIYDQVARDLHGQAPRQNVPWDP